jgi:tRNA (guanine37-N1)-methyltransferase
MAFAATVLTLMPEMFPGALGHSLAGEALATGKWSLRIKDIRDHGRGRHRAVDDTPAGGGPGMVIRADVLAEAIDAVVSPDDPRPLFLLSPRGRVFDQALARQLAAGPGAVFVCGRFEGVDERVIEARGLNELSIGDYVLSGGEVAAQVVLDAIIRLLPGVMGGEGSDLEESHEDGLLEYPHYTRPRDFEGRSIPEVLTSGHHAQIAKWRRAEAEKLTKARRPDLFSRKFPPKG